MVIYAFQSTHGAVAPDDWRNTLKRYENLAESEIRLDEVAIDLASDIFPLLNKTHYHSAINKMVAEAKQVVSRSTNPDYRIRALNTYLFQTKKFNYDFDDPLGENIENRLLPGLLDTKKGNCVSLPLLYVIIGQKLGFPVYAVNAPDHLFVRYVDQSLKQQNIETTNGGGHGPNSQYKRDLKISPKAIQRGAYLKTLSNKELLGELLAQNAVYWGRQGNNKKALAYAKVAIKLNPFAPEGFDLMGRIHLRLAKENLRQAELEASLPIPTKNKNQFVKIELLQAQAHKTIGLEFKERAREMGLTILPRDNNTTESLTKNYQDIVFSSESQLY